MPFAIRAAIGKELDLLEQQGIIEKVMHSDWAVPIAPVPKKDGRFRICRDYKMTVNQVLTVEQYLLPRPDDLFTTLAGGKYFSKLDLSQAYRYSWMRTLGHQHTQRAVLLYATHISGCPSTGPVSETDTVLQEIPESPATLMISSSVGTIKDST